MYNSNGYLISPPDSVSHAKAQEQRILEAWQPHIGATPFDADTYDDVDDFTPQALMELLDDVVGNYEAKKAAVMILWSLVELKMPSFNLFYGPTGSGKTEIWRQLQKEYTGMIHIVDISTVSAEGWKGNNHMLDILKNISQNKMIKKHILVLDEFDKIFFNKSSETNYYDLIQSQFLKLAEHEGSYPDCIDLKDLSIVCLGAFSSILEARQKPHNAIGFNSGASDDSKFDIREALVSFGLLPELIGRFDRIIELDSPNLDVYREIGKRELQKLRTSLHKDIIISPDALESICQEALDTQLGGRYIRKALFMQCEQALFDNCFCDQIIIGKQSEHIMQI